MNKIKKINMTMIIVHILLVVFNTHFSNWGGVVISSVCVVVHTYLVATLEEE